MTPSCEFFASPISVISWSPSAYRSYFLESTIQFNITYFLEKLPYVHLVAYGSSCWLPVSGCLSSMHTGAAATEFKVSVKTWTGFSVMWAFSIQGDQTSRLPYHTWSSRFWSMFRVPDPYRPSPGRVLSRIFKILNTSHENLRKFYNLQVY